MSRAELADATRPAGTEITLVVLHSISLPPGEYGGDAIERLFTNCLDPQAHPYFAGDRAGCRSRRTS